MSFTPHEFKIGDVVRLNALGRQRFKKPDRIGTVISISKSGLQIRVSWPGVVEPAVIHWTFLESTEPR